jgi:hypothetical protein
LNGSVTDGAATVVLLVVVDGAVALELLPLQALDNTAAHTTQRITRMDPPAQRAGRLASLQYSVTGKSVFE